MVFTIKSLRAQTPGKDWQFGAAQGVRQHQAGGASQFIVGDYGVWGLWLRTIHVSS